ncbi:MAG: hypothetical protein PW789_18630 [Edaphobacter sp.]|uniref:hypothetical protein n=1 Tax=Edaphobacter sp. TaxID=1934404 RepID=UPI00238E058F|nr:hypothetical protein [Edaphobacter sp.]MDE1178595.1 hypothetical protein [Edaphobacter sp.]
MSMQMAKFLLVGCCCTLLRAQQASVPASVLETPSANEFHVDGRCRIHEMVATPQGSREHVYRDGGICSVDAVQMSSRTETDISATQRKRIHVKIQEHTFTLHNPTTERVVFVLEQAVPKGWQIDSDPQPNKVEGTLATFMVTAEPRQTVSIHVGERNPPD